MKHLTFLLALICFPVAAHADPGQSVASMEAAHGAAAYRAKAAVAAEFVVDFPGRFRMAGTMSFDTPVGRARLDLEDGTVVVFDGKTAWAKTADGSAPSPRLRFHALTWPYFLATPFKMSDAGVNRLNNDTGAAKQPGRFQVPSVKITFDAGTGDAPDDWYYLFIGDEGVLEAAAYIVTYGKTLEEAEAQPSIIVYEGYEEVEGVAFSTRWSFFLWDKGKGAKLGSKKGTATVSSIRFMKPGAGLFERPAGAVEIKAPKG